MATLQPNFPLPPRHCPALPCPARFEGGSYWGDRSSALPTHGAAQIPRVMLCPVTGYSRTISQTLLHPSPPPRRVTPLWQPLHHPQPLPCHTFFSIAFRLTSAAFSLPSLRLLCLLFAFSSLSLRLLRLLCSHIKPQKYCRVCSTSHRVASPCGGGRHAKKKRKKCVYILYIKVKFAVHPSTRGEGERGEVMREVYKEKWHWPSNSLDSHSLETLD